MILKPRCRYNLCTFMILSATFSIFRFLIILPVANMMCRDMVLKKPITLLFMRSQKTVSSFYLSRMVLETLFILRVSTCYILRCTVLPFRCGMLGPKTSSAILTSSRRIWKFCRILLSTAWRIQDSLGIFNIIGNVNKRKVKKNYQKNP